MTNVKCSGYFDHTVQKVCLLHTRACVGGRGREIERERERDKEEGDGLTFQLGSS